MSQHHAKNICRSLHLASIFAAVSKKERERERERGEEEEEELLGKFHLQP